MNMKNQNIQKERGSALLISVIIASSLLIVGVEVSMFVVSTIRQARNIDQTLVASYAAESGVESALHQIRREGRTTLRTDTVDTPDNYYKDDTTKIADKRNARWTFKKGDAVDPEKFNTAVTAITKSFLGEQEGLDIHLYSNDETGFSAVTSRMQDMVVSWKSHACAVSGQFPWIETTAVSWSLTGKTVQWQSSSTSPIRKNFQQSADGAQVITVPLSELIPPDQSLSTAVMTLRVKPFFCTLRNVSISFLSSDTPQTLVPIPNYVHIAPLGTYGSSQKMLSVIAPQKSGMSGVFDFALFSEEVVDKKEQ